MKPNLKQHIGYWINRVRTSIHQAFEQRLARYDISVAQWCTLLTIYDKQNTSISELAAYIEIDKASISRVVERLVQKNLVDHAAGKDRRSGLLTLTAKGQELVPLLLEEAESNEQFFFGDLSIADKAQLQRLLRKLITKTPTIKIDGWLKMEIPMPSTETITNLLARSKEEQWPYPKTFQALQEAGVASYRVQWGRQHKAIYTGSFGQIEEELDGYKPLHIATTYSGSRVAHAIKTHQNGQTTYLELLADLSAAGVSHYTVDMTKRTVTYFDLDEQHSHQESVPAL